MTLSFIPTQILSCPLYMLQRLPRKKHANSLAELASYVHGKACSAPFYRISKPPCTLSMRA